MVSPKAAKTNVIAILLISLPSLVVVMRKLNILVPWRGVHLAADALDFRHDAQRILAQNFANV